MISQYLANASVLKILNELDFMKGNFKYFNNIYF